MPTRRSLCGARTVAVVLASLVVLLALASTLDSGPSHELARNVRAALEPARGSTSSGLGDTADTSGPSRAAVYEGYRTAVFPVEGRLNPRALVADACELCFCPYGRVELGSHDRPQLRPDLRVGGPVRDVADVGPILRSIQLQTICPSVHVHNASLVGAMLTAEPADTLAFDVSALQPSRPTLYWMMSTSAFALRR